MIKIFLKFCLISFCFLFSILCYAHTYSLHNNNVKSLNIPVKIDRFNNLLVIQPQHDCVFGTGAFNPTNDATGFDFIEDNIEEDEENHDECFYEKKGLSLTGNFSFIGYYNIESVSCLGISTSSYRKANYCYYNLVANKYALFCVFII